MKNAWRLFRVQLSAMLGFNTLRHMKDRTERRKKGFSKMAIWVCLLCLLPMDIMYSYLMATGLQAVGALSAFPGVMMALTCLMTLITSIPGASGALYKFKDYEQVMSLPVHDRDIALSRLLLVYAYNLLFALLMLPAGGVYAYLARPGWPFYPIFLAAWLLAPVIPMMVGCAIGALLSWASSRIRGSKYIGMLFTCLVSLAILYVSFSSGQMAGSEDEALMLATLSNFAQTLNDLAQRVYPLTSLYVRAVTQFDLLALLAFALLSGAVFYLMVLFFGRNLRRINTAMNTTRSSGRYRLTRLSTSSPLRALYRREMRHYVGTPIYLMNTAFSLLLALLGLGILCFRLNDVLPVLLEQLGAMGIESSHLSLLGGVLIAVFTGMCCTTGVSISLEGKQLWMVKSLPVTGYQVLLSKLLVNWTLVVPASLIFSTALALLLGPTAAGTPLLFLLPLGSSLLCPVFGLLINLRHPSFDWTNETAVVKQSASAGISTLLGMLLPIGYFALLFLLPEHMALTAWLITLAQALLLSLLLLLIRRRADRWILRL